MKKNKGFTLIELLVVIIIVGILAAVSIPIVRNVQKRAVLTEAIAQLGMIRTAERAYYLEHGEYQILGWLGDGICPDGIKPRDIGPIEETYGTGDLDGTYFSQGMYQIKGDADRAFVLSAI